jgi:hypothetical protein
MKDIVRFHGKLLLQIVSSYRLVEQLKHWSKEFLDGDDHFSIIGQGLRHRAGNL